MDIFGTILQYKRFAVHDGDGIRTTLFLKGCPLSCKWCHNPEGIGFVPELACLAHKCIGCGECAAVCPTGAQKIGDDGHTFDRSLCAACGKCADACLGGALTLYGRKVSAREAADTLLLDRDFFTESGGGVTLSGGEPLMQPEFTAEVFRLCRAQGVSTALDTCGYAPRRALDLVLPFTDKVLFDIKALDSAVHEAFTGRPNALIHENLRYINSLHVPTEIRIPLIPGVNDGESGAIADFLAPLDCITAVRILPYHKYAETKYESLGKTYAGKDFETPSRAALEAFAAPFAPRGIRVIF